MRVGRPIVIAFGPAERIELLDGVVRESRSAFRRW
jgi:hypothetical protein